MIVFIFSGFGTVADWAMVILTGGLIWQARSIFIKDGQSVLKIAIQLCSKTVRDSTGLVSLGDQVEYHFWATNVGRVAGSYVFAGFMPHLSNRKFRSIRKHDGNLGMIDPDPAFFMEDRKFELIGPNDMSQEIVIDANQVCRQFPSGSHVDLCYMDTVGNIVRLEVVLPGRDRQ